jgi:tetratricopeptide (TPR) repeat protein
VNPERWQQIKGALHEALELEPQERQAYIDATTAGDRELRGELESLLAAHEQARDSFLNTPAAGLTALDDLPVGDPWIGRQIGPYRLIEEIGSGGMGEVYRATRADDEYEKQVAVKLIRTGQDSAFVVNRFRTERQILASLDHPNIARLLDGGKTVEGLPYFVMELITGEPIDRYCEHRRLDVNARLRLFLQVCAAVQYAHQRLIVHRDLKPGNILVNAEAVPKLLDFGIAKILESGPSTESAGGANSVIRLLTPDYASPEQARGEPITTASDVYSLGLVLYELLAGVRASDVTVKPSVAARQSGGRDRAAVGSAQKLAKRLRGDLDTIVLMALRADPAQRYDSVERFAEDFRRHLDHLPVVARKATLGYRTRSFVVRYRIGIAAGALIAVALIGGLLATHREAQIANAALARARDESRASNEVMSYLMSLFDTASPDKTGGKPIDPRRLIDQGQEQIDAHFADRPMLRARMLAAVGSLYCKIGLVQPCSRDLEQALAIQSVNSGDDPAVLAQFQVELAGAYTSAGRANDAIALLKRALPVLQAQRPRDDHDVAAALYELGRAYRTNKDPQHAIDVLEQARRLLRDGSGRDTLDSSDTLGALAIAYSDAARLNDAVSLARTRVALVERALGASHVRYFDALNDSAEVLWEAGNFDEAERDWRQVIDGYVSSYGRASEKSIDVELSLADDLYRRDKLRESIDWFRRSVDDYRILGTLDRAEYLGALGGLGQVLWLYGDYRGAEAATHEAYTRARQMPGMQPRELVTTGFRWGHMLSFVGNASQGVDLLMPDMPGDPKVISVRRFQGLRLLWLADCYRELGDRAHALESYDQAIALYQSLTQPHNVAMHMAYEGKALLLGRERRFAEAVPLLRLVIAGYGADEYPADGPAIAAAKVELAAALASLGKFDEARSLIDSAGPIVDRELAPTHAARRTLQRLRAELNNRGAPKA